MKSILTTIALLILSLTLTGCNTMQGMGKDIKAGGKKLENAADNNKPSKTHLSN